MSERCIVSLLDRVVEVKRTYILLLSEIQSPKGHLNLYTMLFFCNTPNDGEELFLMNKTKQNKIYITFEIDSPLMMAQSRAESTRDTYNYGHYINQFPPNTIKVIREFERIQKKICRHKISIMFNEICINEEMLPKYTYTYIYIYIYIYIYMCVCVCVCMCVRCHFIFAD